jgi:hypothetical protein
MYKTRLVGTAMLVLTLAAVLIMPMPAPRPCRVGAAGAETPVNLAWDSHERRCSS